MTGTTIAAASDWVITCADRTIPDTAATECTWTMCDDTDCTTTLAEADAASTWSHSKTDTRKVAMNSATFAPAIVDAIGTAKISFNYNFAVTSDETIKLTFSSDWGDIALADYVCRVTTGTSWATEISGCEVVDSTIILDFNRDSAGGEYTVTLYNVVIPALGGEVLGDILYDGTVLNAMEEDGGTTFNVPAVKVSTGFTVAGLVSSHASLLSETCLTFTVTLPATYTFGQAQAMHVRFPTYYNPVFNLVTCSISESAVPCADEGKADWYLKIWGPSSTTTADETFDLKICGIV